MYCWVFIVLLFFLLSGCLISQIASVEESSPTWIGEPIIRLKKRVTDPNSYASSINWKETIYQLENGHYIYLEPVRKNCFIRWEVNQDHIIIGYKTEGDRCF